MPNINAPFTEEEKKLLDEWKASVEGFYGPQSWSGLLMLFAKKGTIP